MHRPDLGAQPPNQAVQAPLGNFTNHGLLISTKPVFALKEYDTDLQAKPQGLEGQARHALHSLCRLLWEMKSIAKGAEAKPEDLAGEA